MKMKLIGLLLASASTLAIAQEKSVRPGVNDTFREPDPKAFIERFEIESREVFAKRKEILAAIKLKPTDVVADIGAGTGLFTRLFAGNLGPEGRVIAVDIAQKFLDHIEVTCREQGLRNVETLLCKDDSTELPPESVDVAFICDTYHHFEFPQKTMTSLLKALKPGGRVVLIDFRRVEGESSDWTMDHVRAGQEVFEAEVMEAGFRKADEIKDLLKENYMVVFERAEPEQAAAENSAIPGRNRGRGMGAGRGAGGGRGMGPDAAMRADQDVFHYLLERHELIRREVKNLDNGVETITESDDKAVAARIQEHVEAMHERVKAGRGLRFWDELFVAIFKNHEKIRMVVEKTEHGVKVIETSEDAHTVKLIQAHAVVVSKFVKRGFDEAHENHSVPPVDPVPGTPPVADASLLFPIIEGYGGIVAVTDAVEPPRAGVKVVLDVTSEAKKPEEVNKGLDRAARLLNLYGTAGLKASDIKVTVVLHGEATKSVLSDEAWESRLQIKHNPNLPLIRLLQKAGVEVMVCGQALSYKKIERSEVASDIPVASAALTVLLNRQADGFAYVPVP